MFTRKDWSDDYAGCVEGFERRYARPPGSALFPCPHCAAWGPQERETMHRDEEQLMLHGTCPICRCHWIEVWSLAGSEDRDVSITGLFADTEGP